MEPVYFKENRYTYLVGSWRRPASSSYVVADPEGAFEQKLQELFLEGQAHLHHEEYTLALQAFQEALALILRTVHPTMPVDPNQLGPFHFPVDVTFLDPLVLKTAEILSKTVPVKYGFPPSVLSDRSIIPSEAQRLLEPATGSGLLVKSFHGAVIDNVNAGLEAASLGDLPRAVKSYEAALELAPDDEATIRGGLLHDLAILNEKKGDREKAQELGQASVKAFSQVKILDAEAQALATTAGIFARAGDSRKAQ
jgi:tetratricopeptide (TPR) repeat protein